MKCNTKSEMSTCTSRVSVFSYSREKSPDVLFSMISCSVISILPRAVSSYCRSAPFLPLFTNYGVTRWSPILPARDCSLCPAKKNILESGHAKKNLDKTIRLTSHLINNLSGPADEGWHGNRCVTSARHRIYA